MFGMLIGTVCLIALVSTMRRAHWRRGYGGWRHPHAYGRYACRGPEAYGPESYRPEPWERGGAPFGRGGGRPMMLRWLFDKLRTTPEQERAIADAIDEAREQKASFKKEARASRKDVARSFRGESVEETVLGEVFSRHDNVIEGARKAFVHALVKIHAALDERQRATLADLVEGGWRAWV
ncbi:MAG: Spy/CpxP family protein refolding chaperone [Polyangiales bacterium]